MHKIKDFFKKHTFMCILEVITFVAILVTGIIFKQSPLRIAPLFISLVVMFLQSQVNRYAFLLGGLNSILYAVSYVTLTLYAGAAQALLVSFPLQMITFFNWKKKTTGGVTELRRMSWPVRFIWIGIFAISWSIMYLAFSFFGSSYLVLDNTGALLGVIVTVLSLLRFSEYAPLQLCSTAITLTTHIVVFLDAPSNITYVIYTVYSAICLAVAMIKMNKSGQIKKA